MEYKYIYDKDHNISGVCCEVDGLKTIAPIGNDTYNKIIGDDSIIITEDENIEEKKLEAKKKLEKGRVSADIGARIANGFEYDGEIYKVDSEKDFINYLALKVCSENGYFSDRKITKAKVTKKNGGKSDIAVNKLTEIAYACMDHVFALRMEGQERDEAIDACESLQELEDLLSGS